MLKYLKLRRRIILIPIFGGLGNQLFQYAFAIKNAELPDSRVILIDSSGRLNVARRFELKGLVETSKLRIIGFSLPFFNLLFGKLVHMYLNLPTKRQKLLEKFQIYNENSMCSSRSGICIGQFQNIEIAREISEILKKNYSEFQFKHKRKNNFKRENRYVVVHVRRGDYLKEKHGHLSFSYYSSILEDLKIKNLDFIIHTDDVSSVDALGRYLDGCEIIGPNDATPWEVISDMAGAEVVVCANSTLSWWGGWLCMQNGGKVFIPEPWFKRLDSQNKMKYPGFITVDSKWE